jgi:hypothetical protein
MNYRQIYNKAKSQLAQRHNEELHTIMVELGYVKNVKTTKEEVEVEEVLSPKEIKKEEKIANEAQKEIDKIIKAQTKEEVKK